MKLTVVGYARVSTDNQRETENIKTQQKLIGQFCQEQGFNLRCIYSDDGVSGTIPLADRPEGRVLLEAAKKQEFQAVVVYKGDRLGRTTLINENIAHDLHDVLGIRLIGVAETIDLASETGRLMFTLNSALARMERENTLRRSRDATLLLAQEGVWLGGIVPYGYRVEGKDKNARLRVSDELFPGADFSESDVVQRIYTLIGDEGMSCIKVAIQLNAENVPTSYAINNREVITNKRKEKTRGVWTPGRVRNIVIETTYKGVHRWGKRAKKRPNQPKPPVIERDVPRIVDDQTWNRAQTTLAKNRMIPRETDRRRYLLRGMMKCSICGLTYVGTGSKGRSAERLSAEERKVADISQGRVVRRYYVCNGKNPTHYAASRNLEKCPAKAVRAGELEGLLWDDVLRFLRDPGELVELLRTRLKSQMEGGTATQTHLAHLEKKVKDKDDERASLIRSHRKELIGDNDLSSQLKEVEEEKGQLLEQLRYLQEEAARVVNAQEAVNSAEALLSRMQENLDGETPWETKRAILEALVNSIQVVNDPDDRTKAPEIEVVYKFDERSTLSVVDQAKTAADVPVDTYSPGRKCTQTEAPSNTAPAPRPKSGATSPRFRARSLTALTSTSKCPVYPRTS